MRAGELYNCGAHNLLTGAEFMAYIGVTAARRRSNQPESNMSRQAYEVRNPSFSDMNLEQQIEAGINDWCADGKSGHPYFGRTKAEAEAIRAQYADR